MNLSTLVNRLGERAHFLTARIVAGQMRLFDSAGDEVAGVREITITQAMRQPVIATVSLLVRFESVPPDLPYPPPMPKKR